MASRSAVISLQKNGRTIDCKTDKHMPFVVPQCKQPNTTPKFWANGRRHKLWATMSDVRKQNYRNGFNHSRKDWQGNLPVRQTYLQLTWQYEYHLPQFLRPRILQENLLQIKQEESTIYSLIFTNTPHCEVVQDARKLRVCHARQILTIGRTEWRLPKDFGVMITADHKVLLEEPESGQHHRFAVVINGLATQ